MSAVSEYHSVKCSFCTKRVSAEGSESNLMKKLAEIGWKKVNATDFRCKSHINSKIVEKKPAKVVKPVAKKVAAKKPAGKKPQVFGSVGLNKVTEAGE